MAALHVDTQQLRMAVRFAICLIRCSDETCMQAFWHFPDLILDVVLKESKNYLGQFDAGRMYEGKAQSKVQEDTAKHLMDY